MHTPRFHRLLRLRPSKSDLLLLFVAVAIHLSYVSNGFVWLDHGDIESRRTIVNLLNFHEVFLKPFGETDFYRPLVTIVNSLDTVLYDRNAAGFHITNLVLFIAVVHVSSVFLSCFVGLRKREKILIGLIIATHPLGWLPAGAISYRSEILYVLLTELFLIAHVKARLSGAKKYLVSAPFLLIVACFSKETAVVVAPLLVISWEYTRLRKTAFRSGIIFWIELCALLLYFVLRLTAVSQLWGVSGHIMSFSEWVGTRIEAALRMFQMLVDPRLPALSDAIKIEPIRAEFLPLGMFVSALLIVLVIRMKRDARVMTALFCITVLPALSIIPLIRFVSPHYMYFPMIIFSGIIAITLSRLKGSVKRISIGIVSGWIVIMTLSSAMGGARFADDYTLFHPEVVRDDRYMEGHFYLGYYFYERGDLDRADREFSTIFAPRSGVLVFADRTAARYNLAVVAFKKKDYARVMSLIDTSPPAFKLSPAVKHLRSLSERQLHLIP